ncbi:hypothetical protein [Kribbella sp. NPDC051770]|uniref:hypothetical protein n=1 Tax=Kribbella sp. NPDC051770 TaxID=3155413 RepID=UPI0034136797
MIQEDQQQFRCKAGHAWSAEALLATADQRMQAALWTALRTLEEKAALALQMETTARRRGSHDVARRYAASAQETQEAARLIRARLTSRRSGTGRDGDSS